MRHVTSAIRTAVVAAVDTVVLVVLRPDWSRVGTELASPGPWSTRYGVDRLLGDLGATALWLLAAWLLVALLATWATLLPGSAGRLAARLGRRMLPRLARRLLIGSAGLGVLLAPVAAGATTHSASIPTNRDVVSSRLDRGPAERPLGSVVGSTPAPRWPQWPQWPRAQQHVETRTSAPRTTDGDTHHDTAARPSRDGAVTVRRGDSLWLIAQRRLGEHATAGQVAEAWPRWYAANRGVVGDDPDHVTPGQVLHEPSAGATSTK